MTVLLHGLGECADTYGPFANRIRRSSEVIAMDLRGHGGTPWEPDGKYDFNEYADDLRLQLAYWQRKAVLAGTGLGALLAIRASERWPDLVGGLILLGPPPGDPKIASLVDLVLKPGGADIFEDHPSMRASDIVNMLTWARPGGLRAPKFDPASVNVGNHLDLTDHAEPHVPTLIVTTNDDGGPVSWPNWPNVRKVVINGMGNWPHITNPVGTAEAVTTFLDRLNPGSASSLAPRGG